MTDVPMPPASSSSSSPPPPPPAPTTPTIPELRAELTSLNRVSHRLAMTEPGPSLERVLGLLLPRLLRRVGKNDDERRRENSGRIIIRRDGNGGNGNGVHKRKAPSSSSSSSSHSSAAVDGVADGVESMAVDDGDDGDDGGDGDYDDDDDAMRRSSRDRESDEKVVDSLRGSIHDKLVEMIGHAMKRAREDRSCKLPCGALLDSLVPPPPPLLLPPRRGRRTPRRRRRPPRRPRRRTRWRSTSAWHS